MAKQPAQNEKASPRPQQMMQQLQQQMNFNFVSFTYYTSAKLHNALLQTDNGILTPLVNPAENILAPNFPETSAELKNLSWPLKKAFGVSLGLQDPGQGVTVVEKKAFLQRIRFTIGLRPRPA
ncbi:uncharacterized protein L3040_004110 [Drepanopeziza brunnea f. sp. 'multigermtubi']|uniref:uncharacterized protein n=1 Tax=Drepanopeziza brunnea f. sp. 'multigermtubi' TaxID=698441 RepID=UPI0023917C56|nr:hypothetical protein L3040_004110 [Drepanopeziza brunnea f. sp. 'multigermtubi']